MNEENKSLENFISKEENSREYQENLKKMYKWFKDHGREFDFIPEEDRNEELAMAYLLKAEEDFKSSKILFRRRIYRDSLIHTQQGVEKLGKSILLLTGISSEEEMKKQISHYFSKYILKKTRKQFSSFGNYMEDSNFIDLAKRIERFQSIYHNKIPTLKSFNISNISEVGKMYDSLSSNVFNNINWMKEIDFSSYLQDYGIELLTPIIEVEETDRDQKFSIEERKILNKQLEDFFSDANIRFLGVNTYLINVQLVFISLFSSLLEQHFEKARYPENREKIYTKDKEIISILPDIRKISSQIISDYYSLISLNNPEFD